MKLAPFLATGLALGFVASLSGCRANHLGEDTAGHAYRAALAAQRNGDETVEPPRLSAEDAKQVLTVHRTGEAKGTAESSTTILAPTTLTSTPMSSGGGSGAWPGASGNITLEGK